MTFNSDKQTSLPRGSLHACSARLICGKQPACFSRSRTCKAQRAGLYARTGVETKALSAIRQTIMTYFDCPARGPPPWQPKIQRRSARSKPTPILDRESPSLPNVKLRFANMASTFTLLMQHPDVCADGSTVMRWLPLLPQSPSLSSWGCAVSPPSRA